MTKIRLDTHKGPHSTPARCYGVALFTFSYTASCAQLGGGLRKTARTRTGTLGPVRLRSATRAILPRRTLERAARQECRLPQLCHNKTRRTAKVCMEWTERIISGRANGKSNANEIASPAARLQKVSNPPSFLVISRLRAAIRDIRRSYVRYMDAREKQFEGQGLEAYGEFAKDRERGAE